MRYASGNSENLLMNNYHRLTLVLAIALALGLAPSAFGATAVKQKMFASAEEGVKALMEAVKKNDTNAVLTILGPEAKSLIESGDQVSDRAAGERFVKSYEESNKLVKSGDTKAVLEVGKDAWPFPIPLVKESAGWRFDTEEGKEEIINRRVGRNELDAIQVLWLLWMQSGSTISATPMATSCFSMRKSLSAPRESATVYIGRLSRVSNQVLSVSWWLGPEGRDTRAPEESRCRIMAIIINCSRDREKTRRAALTII